MRDPVQEAWNNEPVLKTEEDKTVQPDVTRRVQQDFEATTTATTAQ